MKVECVLDSLARVESKKEDDDDDDDDEVVVGFDQIPIKDTSEDGLSSWMDMPRSTNCMVYVFHQKPHVRNSNE